MAKTRSQSNELDIDLTRLEMEWLRQPRLFQSYASQLADAKSEVDRLKSRVAVVEAETHLDILTNPGKYNLKKTTDSVLKQAVTVAMGKKPIVKKLRQAKHHADVLQTFVEGLDQKKSALENLVRLWTQSYFSTPREPKEGGLSQGELQDKAVLRYREKK